MANNHTCHLTTQSASGKSVTLKYISTPASNIKILSFSRKYGRKTIKTVKSSGEYGMNASWFDIYGDNHIMNLAYQNGVRQGFFLNDEEVPTVPAVSGIRVDGYANSVGKSIIYYQNGLVQFATDVTSRYDSKVLDSTWVQGGAGLFFGYTDWATMFDSEGTIYPTTGEATSRSALVVNTGGNMVYLVTTPSAATIKQFREAIMSNFAITEGDTNTDWRGILLDGGGSSQLVGSTVETFSTRPIPQMIALIDKN